MKFLDKFNLVLFSIIILIISLIFCIITFGWIDLDLINRVFDSIAENSTLNTTVLIISVFLIIASLKSTLFNSLIGNSDPTKDGILLENDNGKLLVSRDTIESLVNTVVKSFESTESSTTRAIVDNENNIIVSITLFVNEDAIIKDLSSKLQNDVKNAIKKSLDLEVKEVNIKIKNISTKKEI